MRCMIIMLLLCTSACTASIRIGYPSWLSVSTGEEKSNLPPDWWKEPVGSTDNYYHCSEGGSQYGALKLCLNRAARAYGLKSTIGLQQADGGYHEEVKHHFLIEKFRIKENN